jgi:hypothetical protein
MSTPFKLNGFSGFGNTPLHQSSTAKAGLKVGMAKALKNIPKYSVDDQGEILEYDASQAGTSFEWIPTEFHTDTDSIVTNKDGAQIIVPKKK